MAYDKHTWETGEVITAEKLNNMENGIEAANKGVLKLYLDQYDEPTAEGYSGALYYDAAHTELFNYVYSSAVSTADSYEEAKAQYERIYGVISSYALLAVEYTMTDGERYTTTDIGIVGAYDDTEQEVYYGFNIMIDSQNANIILATYSAIS